MVTTTPLDRAPMALTGEWEGYKCAALAWIKSRRTPWTADDLAAAVPYARDPWPGEVVQLASRRRLIYRNGECRPSKRPSRKGSLVRVWETVEKEDDQ